MDADHIAIARACLDAAQDGTLDFPSIVGKLIDAGFEGYTVDYRRNSQTYFLASGDNVELAMPPLAGTIAAAFDAPRVEALVRWAQAGEPDYSYAAFSREAKTAGCAGYLVSFLGRRVVYYGRTAETHIEAFPT